MFPSNPYSGQRHTEQNKEFLFNGEGWVPVQKQTCKKDNIYVQSTPPENPDETYTWISSVTLNEYKWLGAWVCYHPNIELTQNSIIDANFVDLDGEENEQLIIN